MTAGFLWPSTKPMDEFRQCQTDEDDARHDTTDRRDREPIGLVLGWWVHGAPRTDANAYNADDGRPSDCEEVPSVGEALPSV
jgi:hypothetical protein